MITQTYEAILAKPLLGLALAVGCLLVLYMVYSYLSSWYRLREFDGPPLASLSYLWMFWTSLAGEQGVRYGAVTDKYGRLARIGPNDLLSSDPELLRRMSAVRSRYGRSSWYNGLRIDPYVPALVNHTGTVEHDKLRAQAAPGYQGRENPDIEAGIDEQIANLKALIRRNYLSSNVRGELRPMDLAAKLGHFTLDAITRIAYGREFGYLETESDVYSHIKTTARYIPWVSLLADIPGIAYIALSKTALKLIGPKPTDKVGLGRTMAVAQKIVGERFGPNAKDERDMLGSFVRHGLSRRQCESEVLTQIIAGSDTTATALRGTMLYIMATPHVYYRLQREIDDTVAAGKVSSPIRPDESRELEYLQAVIYEGLRINLAFTGLIMKEVPPEGDTIEGRFVPGGTRVAQSILPIQRSREVFGGDAEIFRPERWLFNQEHGDNNNDDDRGTRERGEEGSVVAEVGEQSSRDRWDRKKREMMQTVELVFGSGRWGCLGKPVAFLELNKIFFELLREFDFQLINVNNPIRTRNHSVFFQTDMWVKITERTKFSM